MSASPSDPTVFEENSEYKPIIFKPWIPNTAPPVIDPLLPVNFVPEVAHACVQDYIRKQLWKMYKSGILVAMAVEQLDPQFVIILLVFTSVVPKHFSFNHINMGQENRFDEDFNIGFSVTVLLYHHMHPALTGMSNLLTNKA